MAVSLEQNFDIVEKALFCCSQKQDESADSYLARSEVVWTELLVKKINLAEVQAYVSDPPRQQAGPGKQ